MSLLFIPSARILSLCWPALLSVSLGTPSGAAAQQLASDSLTISGIVKHPNGLTAGRRAVTLGSVGVRGETELQTITNGQGRFRFTVASDSLQPYPKLSCFYFPKLGWNFQTAGADIESKEESQKTYVLQLKKRSKLARWWAVRHPPY